MPEVEILIGGRSFSVACQEGEEQYLYSAAHILMAKRRFWSTRSVVCLNRDFC